MKESRNFPLDPISRDGLMVETSKHPIPRSARKTNPWHIFNAQNYLIHTNVEVKVNEEDSNTLRITLGLVYLPIHVNVIFHGKNR